MAVSDIVFIILISIGSTLLSEGISWLLIYRTEQYKRSKQNIEKLQAQIDKIKEQESHTAVLAKKGKDKKLERAEESLKNANKDLTTGKMKSMFAVAISMVALFSYLNSIFDGKVVCKLPFEPIGFLQGFSHRNLAGNDFTDCSMTFIYVLCSMGIRSNIQMILGTAPPKQKGQQNPFFADMDAKSK
ncbi:hypothetical protein DLAC_06001 [Tieghemostelium lacteum]|uniref:Calcium load-activated calcium channel n=1 Tax=Tieghemostelium lacteum TaxID=361077 RepID=A0A151ZH68_TIELA|nr:hypothetical protein DLAC_06001 [Tieghemostelium lacteum]|eukprot:KYQ93331.1 hypothetical protein DLAC_06001 [Tieghemostelium lacteum]